MALNDKLLEEARRLRQQGWTIVKIAGHLRVSAESLGKHIGKLYNHAEPLSNEQLAAWRRDLPDDDRTHAEVLTGDPPLWRSALGQRSGIAVPLACTYGKPGT